ncbi:MAG: YkvA family protein [Candidatus Eisenbacteria bacterium]
MSFLDSWKRRVRDLRVETHALYLACRDPRVPWYAKAFAACVVGYALSPIDLIPDFIPVLGYLDDLVLVPLGVLAARRMIPKEVLAECRERALAAVAEGVPVNRTAAAIIIGIWVLGAAAAGWMVFHHVAAPS